VDNWILIELGIIILVIVIAVVIGCARESTLVTHMLDRLIDRCAAPDDSVVDFNSLSGLPHPVSNYLKHVLANGQKMIKIARMHQSGILRTSMKTVAWSLFTADQVVVPPATGFVWSAKVEMPLGTHVRVLDSYSAGVGAGRVSLLSAIAVASDSGGSELNSAALLRYLAEAVWYPTALSPQSGVVWSEIDDRSALATLTNYGITVSLVFRFNDVNEVIAIYSPGRFSRIDGKYKQLPWEGHFRDYQIRGGMRIPIYGEVGWYEDETLQLVWKGNIIDTQYQFSRERTKTRSQRPQRVKHT